MSLSARGPVTWPVPVPWLTLTARGPCGCSWRRRRRHRPVNHPLRSASAQERRLASLSTPPPIRGLEAPPLLLQETGPSPPLGTGGRGAAVRACARSCSAASCTAGPAPEAAPPRARALVLRFRVLSSPWLSPNHLTALRGTLPHFPVLHCHPRPLSLRPALRGLPDSRSRGFWGLLPKACLTWRRSWALREW